MKLLVESFGVNSRYIDELKKSDASLRTYPNDQPLQIDRKWYWDQMIKQAEILKQLDGKLHTASDEMFKRFEELERRQPTP